MCDRVEKIKLQKEDEIMNTTNNTNNKECIEYNVFEIMKEKGVTTTNIRNDKVIGQSQLTSIRKNQSVSMLTLKKLSVYLHCEVKDLIK